MKRSLFTAALVVLISCSAFSQADTVAPKAQAPREQLVHLTFSIDAANRLIYALERSNAEHDAVVSPLIREINDQLNQQFAPPAVQKRDSTSAIKPKKKFKN